MIKKLFEKIKNQPELLFFYLFVLSIPIQTRKVFLGQSLPLADGFIEYTNFFLYLSDILLVTTLLCWFVKTLNFKEFKAKLRKKTLLILGIFLIWSIFSLTWAGNRQIGFYQVVKLAEFFLLFWFIIANIRTRKRLFVTFFCLFLAGFFQSILAIGQYLSQKSLGLRLFGESILAPDKPGVAKIVVEGEKIVRAYGTLPHPNILAGFLILSILAGFALLFRTKINPKWLYMTLSLALSLQILGFLLTFSRTAWVGGLIAGLVFLGLIIKKCSLGLEFSLNKLKIASFGFILLVFIISISLLWPQISSRFYLETGDQALSQRVFYLKNALNMVKERPLLGIGLGNFTLKLPQNLEFWQYQPVHNIFLLISAELGLIGLILFHSYLKWIWLEFE